MYGDSEKSAKLRFPILLGLLFSLGICEDDVCGVYVVRNDVVGLYSR